MGKKGKKALAGKPKKPTPKDIGKRLDALVKNLEEELEGVDLFAPLPPAEDCAICLVPLPYHASKSETWYKACCGNFICWACYMENKESIIKQNEEKTGKKVALTCPFCREPEPTSNDGEMARLQARCLQGDHNACFIMGDFYQEGLNETPKDDLKALDCFIRAIELGSPEACLAIANRCDKGDGVAVDKERAALFTKVGALRGDVLARHNIGLSEYFDHDNYETAIRHWKIAAEAGLQRPLNVLRKIYEADGEMPGKEFISKEYLDFAYRACHNAQMEVKSEEREKHLDTGLPVHLDPKSGE